jgi:hypothetical protein
LRYVLQAQLEAESGDDEGLQLDAAQLAEYRKLKGEADAKTSRLLQDRTTHEAQLKVRCSLLFFPGSADVDVHSAGGDAAG